MKNLRALSDSNCGGTNDELLQMGRNAKRSATDQGQTDSFPPEEQCQSAQLDPAGGKAEQVGKRGGGGVN